MAVSGPTGNPLLAAVYADKGTEAENSGDFETAAQNFNAASAQYALAAQTDQANGDTADADKYFEMAGDAASRASDDFNQVGDSQSADLAGGSAQSYWNQSSSNDDMPDWG